MSEMLDAFAGWSGSNRSVGLNRDQKVWAAAWAARGEHDLKAVEAVKGHVKPVDQSLVLEAFDTGFLRACEFIVTRIKS